MDTWIDIRPEEIGQAEERQRARGALRWLIDEFCRPWDSTPTRGELLDQAAGVFGFVGASEYAEFGASAVSNSDLEGLKSDVRGGLRALFESPNGVWRLPGMPLALRTTRDPDELKRKVPADAVDHRAGMFVGLLMPVHIRPMIETPSISAPLYEPSVRPLRQVFCFRAAQEIEKGWDLLGRCPRCLNFFYRVRRQLFCTPKCKQEEMNERKARRRARKKRKIKRR